MSPRRYRIALLPGDGIGPDVVAEGVKVLRAIPGLCLEFEEFSAGVCEYRRCGDPLPQATLDRVKGFDAILLGAMGLPDVRWPNGLEMTPQIDLRERLDLYCGLRPIRLFHPLDSPLKSPEGIEFLIVRENTEGLFSARKQNQPGAGEATDLMHITRGGSERIFHAAFREAARRKRKVTLVDKANVLPSMAYFRAIFNEVAASYPEIETERVYVDAMALYLVERPQSFDVIVTENMFGDILSDLAAALVGGMGMAPSADIGEHCAVFQPSHGTAPDIAGRGIANPIATILSAAMMIEWLSESDAADRVRRAVERVLADPANRTPDMGGKLTTSAMGNLVAEAV